MSKRVVQVLHWLGGRLLEGETPESTCRKYLLGKTKPWYHQGIYKPLTYVGWAYDPGGTWFPGYVVVTQGVLDSNKDAGFGMFCVSYCGDPVVTREVPNG